ncbi:MAG: IPExxxVDY family protein [Bacteroidales bacterium]|nr:IPExxxVDY family protein [Bacteroidales bacterium]
MFSRFSDNRESPDRVFNLISNRSGKQFLIRKLKNIDYILHLHDPDKINNISQITLNLREITSITAVFNIDIDSIKDKNLHFVIQ